ncbi:MAG: hypothetical protein ACK476_15810, partial [Fluviicola sp.]
YRDELRSHFYTFLLYSPDYYRDELRSHFYTFLLYSPDYYRDELRSHFILFCSILPIAIGMSYEAIFFVRKINYLIVLTGAKIGL